MTLHAGRLICAIGILSLLSACSSEDTAALQAEARAIPVLTAVVEKQAIADRIEAVGSTRASESITIAARVSNIVTRIGFEEGALVEKGQLLIELESSEARANLAVAEAALLDIRRQVERSQELIRSNSISESVLDQQRAQLQAAEARLAAAKAALADHSLRAPFAGRVGLRHVSPGSLVTPGTPITTLDKTDVMQLDFEVPETFISDLRQGLPITAASAAYPGESFVGRVANIDARVDRITRSVTVRADLPNEAGKLLPGMFMTVILENNPREAIVVPEQSIVPEGSRKFVFVVNGNTVEKREITIGLRLRGVVEVLSGLEVGEIFVTEGIQSLRNGSVVRELEQ